ncbi:hypothetical protein FB451DRAFT_782447 [Mycena latifolia]|nr:hypothetical protein FB451DRAFT_782447 [Mycena latifolia]
MNEANTHLLYLAEVAACAIICFASLWKVLRRSPDTFATTPGPSSPSWIYGNMLQLVLAEHYGDHEFKWQKQYGPLYRVKGCFGEDRLVISDPLALRHKKHCLRRTSNE